MEIAFIICNCSSVSASGHHIFYTKHEPIMLLKLPTMLRSNSAFYASINKNHAPNICLPTTLQLLSVVFIISLEHEISCIKRIIFGDT